MLSSKSRSKDGVKVVSTHWVINLFTDTSDVARFQMQLDSAAASHFLTLLSVNICWVHRLSSSCGGWSGCEDGSELLEELTKYVVVGQTSP